MGGGRLARRGASASHHEQDDVRRMPRQSTPDSGAADSRLERLPTTDGEDEMRLLRWEAMCAIVAFALTLAFILVPGPYAMAIFTFVAQPLFAIVAIGYLLKVRADLRKRGLQR